MAGGCVRTGLDWLLGASRMRVGYRVALFCWGAQRYNPLDDRTAIHVWDSECSSEPQSFSRLCELERGGAWWLRAGATSVLLGIGTSSTYRSSLGLVLGRSRSGLQSHSVSQHDGAAG